MRTTPKITRERRGLLATMVRFLRGRGGAVSPIMALAIIPIVGAMGMGAEASSWWLTQRSAQNAADAAAMAAAVDAGNNYSGTSLTAVPPTDTTCATATDTTTSWYCQAKATAAKYNFADGSNNVIVTPQKTTCPTGVTTYSTCFKVTVQKAVPLYLLNVVGFNGNTTIGTRKAQFVSATAYAGVPGPPIDFCLLTTNGDISASGSPKADLQGCDTFSNGNASCNGSNGLKAGESLATGSSSGCATDSPAINKGSLPFICDPYGPTTQTFGKASETCSTSTNLSNQIPPMTGCNSATASANDALDGTGNFPATNVITGNDLNAVSGSTGAIATTMTIPAVTGTSMQVIQVCGTATFSNTAPVGTKGSVASCSAGTTLNYTGTAKNLVIIIYDGGLDMNGCTLVNNEPTSTGGGMTIVFAPSSPTTANSVCPVVCVPQTSNSAGSGGEIDIAAPTAGPFTGLALMQSANYASDGGCGNGKSGNSAGPVDWCKAGNQPSIHSQGLFYMPNADLSFAGAISKFDQTGALTCIGWIVKSFETNGTGSILDQTGSGFGTSATSQCGASGAILPTVPGSHSTFQRLVG